ncbi:MAG: sensor histidine kinase [Chloroflexi bacterium]|nr:sensor histidine kinase [Chloroflexota bacterium]
MQFVHEFFILNHEVVYFVYGLVFFILGLVIPLQSRKSSRPDLARSLNWLAAFGFTHSFNEWGDLFIPIQSTYLSQAAVDILQGFHLLVLAVSFIFLFEFGVTLLIPLDRVRWMHIVPGALLAIWTFIVFFPLQQAFPEFQTWYNVSNALARFFIGFPAAIFSAYALRQHAIQRIVPLKVPHIVRMLQFGGITLFFYGIFAGLVVPPIPFFPGNLLNTDSFENTLYVPVVIIRSLIGLGLALAIIRALDVFNVETERIIESMEQQQMLSSERERIGRELHDGAIQKVYTAGLIVESVYKLAKTEQPSLATRLEKAVIVLNDAIGDLRRSLVDLQPDPNSEPFPEALRKLAEDARFKSLVDITLDLDLPESEPLSPVRSEHVLAVVNEALSNIIRHARAHHVKISAHAPEGRLLIKIEDDGVGLPASYRAGYGLRNMRDRARLLGGKIEVSKINGRGTQAILDVPWKEEH